MVSSSRSTASPIQRQRTAASSTAHTWCWSIAAWRSAATTARTMTTTCAESWKTRSDFDRKKLLRAAHARDRFELGDELGEAGFSLGAHGDVPYKCRCASSTASTDSRVGSEPTRLSMQLNDCAEGSPSGNPRIARKWFSNWLVREPSIE